MNINKEFSISKFKSLNQWYCIAVILAASYVVVLPLMVLVYFVPQLHLGSNPVVANAHSIIEQLFIGVILAPLLETFLYLWLPVKILHNKLKLSMKLVAIVSVLAFSASHPYSLGYLIFSFLMGGIFILGYLNLLDTDKSPFWVLSLTHAIRNLIAILIISLNH